MSSVRALERSEHVLSPPPEPGEHGQTVRDLALAYGPSVRGYLRVLSDGVVRDVAPSGPVFNRKRIERRELDPGMFVTAVSRRARVTLWLLTAAWLVLFAGFWVWWSQPEHRQSGPGFVLNSVLLVYLTGLPIYFLLAANRIRRVSPSVTVPDLRVAMVVTKAPSEPWPLVEKTLRAMLDQDFPYPYDVWLCDENPSQHTRDWCAAAGVQMSTRHGVEGYHRETWPRRRRCKEGNLAYFYDLYGYDRYDVVSQMDADHVPAPDYLTEIVRPFADPAVGYVSAPSVCDGNVAVSWAVRGRLHEEATFHGPQQVGHNGGYSPVCIGSHYAVRTTAVRQIGGIGPELAEDFTTSYLMNAAGWQGAFAIDAHASGDGPTTLRAMLTQEFQWSRSLTTVLLELMPRTIGLMPWRLRFRFAFSVGYYPLLVTMAACGLALLATASAFGIPWVRIDFLVFVLFAVAMDGIMIAIAALLRGQRLMRPSTAPLISWEKVSYVLARPPYVFRGVLAAVAQRVLPRPVDFAVTPKGDGREESLPLRLVLPYLVLTAVLTACALVGMENPRVVGYVGLTFLSALTYLVLSWVVTLVHARDAALNFGVGLGRGLSLIWAPLVLCAALSVPLVYGCIEYAAILMRGFGL